MSMSQLDAAFNWIDEDECARATRFVRERDRIDYIVAHLLLRGLLSRETDVPPQAWRFKADAHGKPSIALPDTSEAQAFSLSHTRGLAACAVTRGVAKIGIDVESVSFGAEGRDVAAHYFAPIERAMLDATDAAAYGERFIELWTLKEAYSKAIGVGLEHPLDSFAFAFDSASRLGFAAPTSVGPEEWHFLLAAPAPGFRLAVAVQTRRHSRCVIRLSDGGGGMPAAILRKSSDAIDIVRG